MRPDRTSRAPSDCDIRDPVLSVDTGLRVAGSAKVLVLCALALTACSNHQIYDAIQQNQQLECQKLPGTQYEECMKQVSEPYESYKRERDELTKKED